jgi:hypothetical protein
MLSRSDTSSRSSHKNAIPDYASHSQNATPNPAKARAAKNSAENETVLALLDPNEGEADADVDPAVDTTVDAEPDAATPVGTKTLVIVDWCAEPPVAADMVVTKTDVIGWTDLLRETDTALRFDDATGVPEVSGAVIPGGVIAMALEMQTIEPRTTSLVLSRLGVVLL